MMLRPGGRLRDAGTATLSWPFVCATHQGLVLLWGLAMRSAASSALAQEFLRQGPVNDVYGGIALAAASAVEFRGIALAGVPGRAASALFPDMVFPRAPSSGPFLGLLVGSETSLFAFYAMNIAASAALALGGALIALRSGRWSGVRGALGLTAITYSVLSVVLLPWTAAEVEAMGLTALAVRVFSVQQDTYSVVVRYASKLSYAQFRIGELLALGALVAGIAAAALWRGPWRRSAAMARFGGHAAGSAPITIALFAASLNAAASYAPSASAPELEFREMAVASDPPPVQPGPGIVTISAQAPYVYAVDGVPQRIKCVGYESAPKATREETRADRERDFRIMRRAGINTINIWDAVPDQDAFLAHAAEHGLGVIVHFPLSSQADYADPTGRASLQADIRAWVVRLKNAPALRMWGLGNEVVHSMGKAAYGSAREAAFSRFLLDTADLVRQLDPDHPVVYREAIDVPMRSLVEALRSEAPRPWFVYGVNTYTQRTPDGWRHYASERSAPLLVTEYAPTAMRPSDRPLGYLKFWRSIGSASDVTLGACAFVWREDGVDPIDRVYGLLDAEGRPLDGVLPVLAAEFHRD